MTPDPGSAAREPIKMCDLARLAGCSTMAVSLALRDSPRVSPGLRERITALAREHGYRPNPLLSALVHERRRGRVSGSEAGTLALLTKLNEPIRSWRQRRTFYSALLEGIDERAEQLGFRVEEFPTASRGAPDARRLNQILVERGLRGILLFPGGGLQREFPDLDWQRFAVVAAGFHGKRLEVHRTASDYTHAMELCLDELTRRGYRRLGLAMTAQLDPAHRYALSGCFFAWQMRQPAPRRVALVPGAGALPERAAFERWIKKEKPDCVLGLLPQLADWLRGMGLELPRDIGLALLALQERSGFAGVDLRTREVGRAAVQLLAGKLHLNQVGPPEAPEMVSIGGVWRDGPTVRPA